MKLSVIALDYDSAGPVGNDDATRHELAHFASQALHGNPLKTGDVEYIVAVGKPAQQIVHAAREEECELIVMSTHGLTAMWKLFFGSTTERVPRETTVSVLVTPRRMLARPPWMKSGGR